MDLRLTHFRHFILVAETKSYRTAAKRAFRSQPALSQSIRQLETRLGHKLFEQRSRTTLTPFGAMCLPLVREILAHTDHALSAMQQVAQVTGGRMTVGLMPSVGTHLLPSLLPAFIKQHPAVQLKIYIEDSHRLRELVADGEIDVAVSSLQKADSRLEFTPLLQDRFGLLCRTDHPLAKRTRGIEWRHLKGQTILGHFAHDLLIDEPVWRYVSNPQIQLSNLPTLYSLVEHGLGITATPALAAPTSSPNLTFVPLVKPVEHRTIGILSAAGRSLLPAAESFVRLVRAQLQAVEWSSIKPFVRLLA
ncbi:MAG TPA: LysR substrate-binding domain-containing protein [Burkholderiales bacterium]|nr:LysR substrate-binding domain-containing protein [Burkholderiales bacterium]